MVTYRWNRYFLNLEQEDIKFIGESRLNIYINGEKKES